MASINVTLPGEAVHAAFVDALLKPARHSHDEAPLAAAARAVVGSRRRDLEGLVSREVDLMLSAEDVRQAIRATLRQALLDAVANKAAGVLRSLSPHTVVSSLFEEPAARERRAIASDLRRQADDLATPGGVEHDRLLRLAERYEDGQHRATADQEVTRG